MKNKEHYLALPIIPAYYGLLYVITACSLDYSRQILMQISFFIKHDAMSTPSIKNKEISKRGKMFHSDKTSFFDEGKVIIFKPKRMICLHLLPSYI
jgi:hypothetical protein